jgi:hypothetical protein
MHHLKATELNYVTIVITFVSSFISLLERHIKPSAQLEMTKRKPRFREEKKNEEIISRNCLPHHKRASTFFNMHKAARLCLFAMLSRYYPISDRVQCDGQYRVQKKTLISRGEKKMKK